MPNVDALTVENSQRVYVDHVSGSWATDENFNAYGQTTELTVAYSIFGEGLRKHSKCALLGSDPTGPQSITFWRNVCVSNNDRNPDNNHYAGSCVDIVDNVFYNAGSEWAEIFTQQPGGTTISLVGNTFKAGPATIQHTYAINWNNIASVARQASSRKRTQPGHPIERPSLWLPLTLSTTSPASRLAPCQSRPTTIRPLRIAMF